MDKDSTIQWPIQRPMLKFKIWLRVQLHTESGKVGGFEANVKKIKIWLKGTTIQWLVRGFET